MNTLGARERIANDPILSGNSEAFIDIEMPRGEIANTI